MAWDKIGKAAVVGALLYAGSCMQSAYDSYMNGKPLEPPRQVQHGSAYVGGNIGNNSNVRSTKTNQYIEHADTAVDWGNTEGSEETVTLPDGSKKTRREWRGLITPHPSPTPTPIPSPSTLEGRVSGGSGSADSSAQARIQRIESNLRKTLKEQYGYVSSGTLQSAKDYASTRAEDGSRKIDPSIYASCITDVVNMEENYAVQKWQNKNH